MVVTSCDLTTLESRTREARLSGFKAVPSHTSGVITPFHGWSSAAVDLSP